MERRRREVILYPLLVPLLLPSLVLILFFLSSCKAGDIGSSSSASSASATVDQSDNSVHGETQCTTTYEQDGEVCSFEQVCDGVEVSSGDFVITATSPCPVPTPEPTTEE